MTKLISSKRRIALIVLSVLLTLSLAFFFVNNSSSPSMADECNVSTETAIKPIYELNETLTIPSATLDYNGQPVESTGASLIFPDGKVYNAESVQLSMAGRYIIRYTAQKDGKLLTGDVEFTVDNQLFIVTGEGASASYQENVSIPGFADKKENGIVVSLPMGGTFTYNDPIDLNDKTKTDSIMNLFTLPAQLGQQDVNNMMIKLTDAYDSTNYIVISTYNNKWKTSDPTCNTVYQSANAWNQASTGLVAGSSGSISYEGGTYEIYRNSDLGFYGKFSFPAYAYDNAKGGKPYDVDGDGKPIEYEYPFTFSMNYEDRKIYGCTPASNSNGMIIDLDDPLFFTDLWQGFTTGEAYLSVYSTNYVLNSFNFIITDIIDKTIDGSSSTVVDDKCPIIEVNYGEQSQENLPYGVLNKEFKLFSATVKDNFADSLPCVVSVFYNYYSNSPVNVSTSNGSFIPKKEGLYSIVYFAQDFSGNQSYEVVDVEVLAQSALALDKQTLTLEPVTGEEVEISCLPVDGSGKVAISAKAVLQSNTKISYDLTQNNGVYSFVPMYAGTYDITFDASDYILQVSEKLTVQVSAKNGFYVISEPNLPYLFIKGAKYSLDSLTAYNLKSGTPVIENSQIEYAFDGNSDFLSFTADTLEITASESVVIRHRFDQNFYQDFEVKVVDVNYSNYKIAMEKYFYGEHFSAEVQENGSLYTTSTDGAQLYFANKLLANNFSFIYKNVNFGFASQTVEIVDAKNSASKLKLEFVSLDSTKTQITVNDKTVNVISFDLASAEINISYVKTTKTLTVNGVNCNYSGFDGFESNLVKLKVTLNGVKEQSALLIKSANTQVFTSRGLDLIGPTMYYSSTSLTPNLNDTFTISDFIIADVLRIQTNFEMTVKAPDGTTCTSVDGASLNKVKDTSKAYSFKLTQYGEYVIRCKIEDSDMNERIINITVTVADKVAPTLTITKEIKEVKLGSEVTFNHFKATDDVDKTVTVNAYVIDPTGRAYTLKDYKYKANVAGKCIVVYQAVDKAGNLASESHTFIVK